MRISNEALVQMAFAAHGALDLNKKDVAKVVLDLVDARQSSAELLAALKELAQKGFREDWLERVNAAIKKAEGQV